jgi:hypothetical protein
MLMTASLVDLFGFTTNRSRMTDDEGPTVRVVIYEAHLCRALNGCPDLFVARETIANVDFALRRAKLACHVILDRARFAKRRAQAVDTARKRLNKSNTRVDKRFFPAARRVSRYWGGRGPKYGINTASGGIL